MFDTNEKERQSIQGQVKTISKQIPNFESNHMKMEVKEEVKTENFENFEAHEQVGIDHITNKDFDHPFMKSETFRMKTEVKAEVKEEAVQEFDTNEQIGMDFIASNDFNHPFSKSDNFRMKTEFKPEIKDDAFEEIDSQEQIGMDFITSQYFDSLSNRSDLSSIKKEIKFDDQIKKEIKEEIKFEKGVQQGLEILGKLEYPLENKIGQETNESQETTSAFEKIREKEDLQLKKEVKVEVKEETLEVFDVHEQIGIDLITNKDFNYA